MKFAKIGAVLYIIWALLHLVAAYQEFALGATLEPGLVRGKINQEAWDLVFFALFGIVVAIKYNWKNDSLGYWLNLIVISGADIGFVTFVLIPGYVSFLTGILGPVFWISAAIFSTLGIRSKSAG